MPWTAALIHYPTSFLKKLTIFAPVVYFFSSSCDAASLSAASFSAASLAAFLAAFFAFFAFSASS